MNKNQRKIKLKFEDYIDQIDEEIRKRKSKWTLTSIAWMDFDDISQILRIHIYKKWFLFDQDKPLGPWLNRIISNQIKNIIRKIIPPNATVSTKYLGICEIIELLVLHFAKICDLIKY